MRTSFNIKFLLNNPTYITYCLSTSFNINFLLNNPILLFHSPLLLTPIHGWVLRYFKSSIPNTSIQNIQRTRNFIATQIPDLKQNRLSMSISKSILTRTMITLCLFVILPENQNTLKHCNFDSDIQVLAEKNVKEKMGDIH